MVRRSRGSPSVGYGGAFLVGFLLLATPGTGALTPQEIVLFTDPEGNVQWDPGYTGEKYPFADIIDLRLRYDAGADRLAVLLGIPSGVGLDPRPADMSLYCVLSMRGFVNEDTESSGNLQLDWMWHSHQNNESFSTVWWGAGGAAVSGKDVTSSFRVEAEKPGAYVWEFDRETLLKYFTRIGQVTASCSASKNMVAGQPLTQPLTSSGGKNDAGSKDANADIAGLVRDAGAGPQGEPSNSNDAPNQPITTTPAGTTEGPGVPTLVAALAIVALLVTRKSRHRQHP